MKTVGEVIKQFRQSAEMRKLVEDCYLDEDVVAAAKRFYGSEEFQASLEIVRARGIHPPAHVLDLGGGNGIASLAWHWAGYQVVLAEPDESDVVGYQVVAPLVHQQRWPIRICGAIAEQVPFRNQTFDLVYARQLMHHVSSLELVCKEVYRVLTSEGLFFNAREHVISKPDDLDNFWKSHPVHKFTGGENAHLVHEYLGALKAAGFRKVKTYGSWQSVINYAPTTRPEFEQKCCARLSRRLGQQAARSLARNSSVQRVFGWYASRNDDTPGRMYTFCAQR
jgi:ubiquinone/menaquinone biosynthesis C-methylase UbiE